MSGMWKRSHGRTSEAPPDERGGYRYVRPTATAPHLDSTHRRRRRRSSISRLTDPTAVDQPLLRAHSSCPRTDLGVKSEGSKVEWVTSSARSRYRRRTRDAEDARKHYGAACP